MSAAPFHAYTNIVLKKAYPGPPMARHFEVHQPVAETAPPSLLTLVDGLGVRAQYAVVVVLIAIVFVLDVLTGYELAFSIFYLGPVSLLAWHRGRRAAFVGVAASGILWLLADRLAGHEYSMPAIQYWNALVRTGFFTIVAYMLTQLRAALEAQQQLARTDALTGVANSRYFMEIASNEIARQKRYGHPLSIAFLDCDDFKDVNDQFGHAAGDDLLRRLAWSVEQTLREVDMVARLGGDEFAILMPESDADAADTVCTKVREALKVATAQYAVTFSMGLVTYLAPPGDVEALLHVADEAMYEAKNAGKDATRHRVIGGEPRTASGSQV